jgi:hypothetical protein
VKDTAREEADVDDRTLDELRARLHPVDALWADAMSVRYGPLLAVASALRPPEPPPARPTPFPPAAEEAE